MFVHVILKVFDISRLESYSRVVSKDPILSLYRSECMIFAFGASGIDALQALTPM